MYKKLSNKDLTFLIPLISKSLGNVFVVRKRLVALFYRAKTPRLNFQIHVDIQSSFDRNPHFRPFSVGKPL